MAPADAKATDYVPVIGELQAAGTTSLRGIAAELNNRSIPTATGTGTWQLHRSAACWRGCRWRLRRAAASPVAAGTRLSTARVLWSYKISSTGTTVEMASSGKY
jgi:hypothetical protein